MEQGDKMELEGGVKATFLKNDIEPEADFYPKIDEPCYCPSGKLFYECCGSTELVRPPPYGLFMFENYLDSDVVSDLVEYANRCDGDPLMVIDKEKSTPNNIVRVLDEARITERVLLGARDKELTELVKTSFLDLTKKCIGQPLEWYEKPDLMRYREGGHYTRHADSQNFDPETNMWNKVIDRDLGMLIYLNDDFEGGELSFYKLNYQIRPRAGAAVLFPSDQRFLHQAETVKKGVRYAVVSWGSLKGTPKIADKPPKTAIVLDD